MTLADRLRVAKKKAGLTWDQLATRTGLGRRTLLDLTRPSKWGPHVDTVKVIADALDVRAGWLAWGEDGPKS
jgi:transcriptional regulator with XRE-family HTH domain